MEWEPEMQKEVFGEIPPQWHLIHHRAHNIWPGILVTMAGTRRLTTWDTARAYV
jgi:hypothetical protein